MIRRPFTPALILCFRWLTTPMLLIFRIIMLASLSPLAILAWYFGFLSLTPAHAQTPAMSGATQITAPAKPPPVPQVMVDQARAQANGDFTTMSRDGVGGQVQEAWDEAESFTGVFEFAFCTDCTYKVRLRERMVTLLELPEGETIDKFDVGDTSQFQVKVRGPNRLAVMPGGFGIDTNVIVYGKTGAIYPFYLRAEKVNSINVPDLLVRIKGETRLPTEPFPAEPGAVGTVTTEAPPPLDVQAVEGLKPGDPAVTPGDFVREAPFDPDKLRGWGEYKLWGDGQGSEALKPETVFRDDHFTYIRFGSKWNEIELPTAYVVVDGIDELVNTRVQGRTYIIESTQKLITLKSGLTFLCIEYGGKG